MQVAALCWYFVKAVAFNFIQYRVVETATQPMGVPCRLQRNGSHWIHRVLRPVRCTMKPIPELIREEHEKQTKKKKMALGRMETVLDRSWPVDKIKREAESDKASPFIRRRRQLVPRGLIEPTREHFIGMTKSIKKYNKKGGKHSYWKLIQNFGKPSGKSGLVVFSPQYFWPRHALEACQCSVYGAGCWFVLNSVCYVPGNFQQ